MSRTVIEDRNTKIDPSKIRCIGDYVLLKLIERKKTKGGIHLAKGKATELAIGKVVSMGSEVTNKVNGKHLPLDDISLGDYGLTIDYMGERMSLKDGDYRFLHEFGIWATVKLDEEDSYSIQEVYPRFNSVLVEPEDEVKTKSGILFLPAREMASEIRMGTVKKVGPGCWIPGTAERDTMTVAEGDYICFRRFAGAEVDVGGKTLRLLQEQDIKFIDIEGRYRGKK